MQLETDLGKWALDEACLMVGRKYENLLNEGKNPFTDATNSLSAKEKYAPVPKRNIKRMKIPDNGIW